MGAIDYNSNNIKLAEFLGWELHNARAYINKFGDKMYMVRGVATAGTEVGDLKFHESYDWLMAVVARIETLTHAVGRFYYLHKDYAWVQIRVDRMIEQPFSQWGIGNYTEPKVGIYKACVQFVEWYNVNKKGKK